MDASLYLDWQHTKHEGSLFTGFRFENRFRPFLEEHRINPVFYVEYEHVNGADKRSSKKSSALTANKI